MHFRFGFLPDSDRSDNIISSPSSQQNSTMYVHYTGNVLIKAQWRECNTQRITYGQHLMLIFNQVINTYHLLHLILLLMINLKVNGLCVDFGGTIIILLIFPAALVISLTHSKLSVKTWTSSYKSFVHNLYTEL